MATKTTVIIRQLSGPSQAPGLNYQVWQSTIKLIGGGEVTLPAPLPVRLDNQGRGFIDVQPGVYYVDQIVPQGATRSAYVVPTSDAPVYFDELAEVTDTAQIGFGPTWAQQAVTSAAQVLLAREDAAAALAELKAQIDAIGSGGGVLVAADEDLPGALTITSSSGSGAVQDPNFPGAAQIGA